MELDNKESAILKTEYEFELPKGYVDTENGTCHKTGIMRLATAADEILPAQDPRVISNPPYVTCIILSRVVTKLGNLDKNQITPKTIENMFLSDLNYLRALYQKINFDNGLLTVCPKCQNKFNVDLQNLD
jgi:hypothetical protein